MLARPQLLLPSLLTGVFILQGCAQPDPRVVQIEGVRNSIQDDDVFIAGTPTRAGLMQMKSRGVTTVIDFRDTPAEATEEKVMAAELGLDYINIPVKPDEITPEATASLLDQMNRHKNEKVLLHCSGGNRAAAMYGAYLGLSGRCTAEEALRRAKQTGLRNPKTEAQLNARLAESKEVAHRPQSNGSASR